MREFPEHHWGTRSVTRGIRSTASVACPTHHPRGIRLKAPEPSEINRGTGAGSVEPVDGELVRFFGYSNDLLAILDDRGFALVLSPSFRRLLGYDLGEITGRRVQRLVHSADRRSVMSLARDLSPGQPVVKLDARILRVDGSTVPTRRDPPDPHGSEPSDRRGPAVGPAGSRGGRGGPGDPGRHHLRRATRDAALCG